MTRADIICNPGGTNDINQRRNSPAVYLVKTATLTWYHFFVSASDNDLYYIKSVDGGFTWGTIVSVKAATVGGVAVWYDKWTPGDAGTKIWLTYMDGASHNVFSRSLDTASDTLGTETTIFDGASILGGVNSCIGLTKAIGGNLYCAFDLDGGTEVGFYRSVDAGANWTVRTDVNEGTSDYYLLAPNFAADTQDIMAIYWDRSADEISVKLYDDSGNSWGETSIAASMVEHNQAVMTPGFALTVDDANDKILLIAWSALDGSNADLRFWSIIADGTPTEGTAVVSNGTDDQGGCALALDTDTTTLYAFYAGKSDGSETMGTLDNIYYKASTDGGATWGAETLLSLLARDYASLYTCPLVVGPFGAVYCEDIALGGGTADPEYFSALLPQQRARFQIGM